MPQPTLAVPGFGGELAAARPVAPRERAARVLATFIFTSLLGLLVVTAIPYGTVEAWWRAFFVCIVFALAMLWIIEGLISDSWISDGGSLLLPMVGLASLAFLQTLPFGTSSQQIGGVTLAGGHTISVDPYETRFFAVQLLGLVLAGIMMFRYASTARRLRALINVVILVAVASAIFGLLRQTTQHKLGFGLPLLPLGSGYGQFINKNHFALLMEMGLGLTLGMILGGAGQRERALIYFAALLPIWTALVLSGSRGALVAMVAQVIAAGLLFSVVLRPERLVESTSRLFRIAASLPLRLALLLVLICGVVFGTLWLGGDRLAARIEESRTEFSSDDTQSRQGVSRNEIWRTTLKMFAAHPVLGVGMGAYWAAVPAFHDASGQMRPQQAHNDYLELLASGGLVGLAIGVWFVVALFLKTRQNLLSADPFRRAACFGATLGIVGVAVHSLVDFGLHMIVNALVFTTLIMIATSKPRWASPKDL